MTEGEVWINHSENDISEGRVPYSLLKPNNSTGCLSRIVETSTDPRYKEISSVREDFLFDDNGVTLVVEDLPLYPLEEGQDYTWNLFTTTYYNWKSSCTRNQGLDNDSPNETQTQGLNPETLLEYFEKTIFLPENIGLVGGMYFLMFMALFIFDVIWIWNISKNREENQGCKLLILRSLDF